MKEFKVGEIVENDGVTYKCVAVAPGITNKWIGSQAEFNSLPHLDPNTIYAIEEKENSKPHVEPPTTLDCVPLHLFPNCCITCEWSDLEEEGYSCASDKMWDDYKAGRCQQINSLIRMSGTDVCKYFEHFEQMGEVGDKDE